MVNENNNVCKHHSGIDTSLKNLKYTIWAFIILLVPILVGSFSYTKGVDTASQDRREDSRAVDNDLLQKYNEVRTREDVNAVRYRQLNDKMDTMLEMQKEQLKGQRKNTNDIKDLQWHHRNE